MFKRIVVGTDGSSTARGAVAVAARMAKEDGATLHLVCAYQMTSAAVSMAVAAGAGGAALTSSEDARTAAASVLDDAAAELRDAGLQLELHAVAAPAADAIIGTAEAVDADMIVVGSRGMKGARRVLGSVPNSVAHRAPCNVLVAKTC